MHDACVRNAYPIMRSVVYSASCLFILQSYAEPKNNHQALALNAVGNIGFYSFLTPNVLMKWSSFKVRQKVVPNLFRLEAKAARISGLKGGSPLNFWLLGVDLNTVLDQGSKSDGLHYCIIPGAHAMDFTAAAGLSRDTARRTS